jgi:Transposase IS66 family
MRRFKEAAQNYTAAADACDMIRELYDIDAKSTSAAQRAQLRQSESRALCERLLAWLQPNTGPTVLSIHEAVNYTLKIWSRLTVS